MIRGVFPPSINWQDVYLPCYFGKVCSCHAYFVRECSCHAYFGKVCSCYAYFGKMSLPCILARHVLAMQMSQKVFLPCLLGRRIHAIHIPARFGKDSSVSCYKNELVSKLACVLIGKYFNLGKLMERCKAFQSIHAKSSWRCIVLYSC